MACVDIPMSIESPEGELEEKSQSVTLVKNYQPYKFLPPAKEPLHHLLQKQAGVLGSLQLASGLLCLGVGMLFAPTEQMGDSLHTLFRISFLTGVLFVATGLLVNLLYKYPELLPECFALNCGCTTVGAVEVALTIVDIANWHPFYEHHLRIELLELLLVGLCIPISLTLCFWIRKEIRRNSASSPLA